MAEPLRAASTVELPVRIVDELRAGGVEVSRLDALEDAVAPLDAVVVTITDVVNAERLAALHAIGVRLVTNVGAGTNNIDSDAAAALGIDVTNTPDVLTDATADIAMGLLLDVSRRITEGDRLVRSGVGWAWAFDFMWGTSLAGKRLGLVGYGRIGKALGRRARAFGMEVLASSRRPRSDDDVAWLSQDELFRQADVVSLHCPLTPETRHLVDAAVLASMKSTAILINTARGAVVDEAALVVALRDGVIAGAGLDVYEDEPVISPGLGALDNVVLAPHLGSATRETREAMAELAARNVLARARGDALVTPYRP